MKYWVSDTIWAFRECAAKQLVSLAYRFDPEIGVDMYGASEAKAVCTAIGIGQLTGDEARRRAYVAVY